MLDGYAYTVVENLISNPGFPYAPAETSNVVKNLVFGTVDNAYVYCLASRGVVAVPGYAVFGPGAVNEGNAFSDVGLFGSGGVSNTYSYPLRGVVSLKSEIPAGGTVLVGSEAWE